MLTRAISIQITSGQTETGVTPLHQLEIRMSEQGFELPTFGSRVESGTTEPTGQHKAIMMPSYGESRHTKIKN